MSSTAISDPRVVAVITGGRSSERERSLLSGRTVLESLTRQGYRAVFLDAADDEFAEHVLEADVCFLAIAGQYAEDGKLQGLLETVGKPYTGSGVMASALGMHKTMAKNIVGGAEVPVLPDMPVPADAPLETVVKRISTVLEFPVILKPLAEGGSIGMTICRDEDELSTALAAIDRSSGWFVERFVTGTAVTAAVLDVHGARRRLPLLETIPTRAQFYDYATKRDKDAYRYRCPADLSAEMADRIHEYAETVHRVLGCGSHSRSDFIVTESGEVYWLEVNTLPGLSATGNFATMAAAGGLEYDELVRILLANAAPVGTYRP